MSELLWLLLPLAAVSGFWAGRRRREPPARRRAPVPEYFQGLTHLLNEEPDKAIEAFIRMAEVDSETVETHFALATLFRRRGEVERAIRIHQNLIARPTLEPQQRAQALLELGRDYMAAGLYDRAESIFQELASGGAYVGEALAQLLAIYEREREWERAVEVARRLARRAPRGDEGQRIAQYLCELGERRRAQGDLRGAERCAREALASHPASVRASLLLADIALERGDGRGALRALRAVQSQDATLVPEALERLHRAFALLGDEEGLARELGAFARGAGGEHALMALVELRRRREGPVAARALLREALATGASLEAARELAGVLAEEGGTDEDLGALAAALGRILEGRARYRCRVCGFRGRTLHWQCPRCKNWDSVRPLAAAEAVDRVRTGGQT